jgi:hypothetical protein
MPANAHEFEIVKTGNRKENGIQGNKNESIQTKRVDNGHDPKTQNENNNTQSQNMTSHAGVRNTC